MHAMRVLANEQNRRDPFSQALACGGAQSEAIASGLSALAFPLRIGPEVFHDDQRERESFAQFMAAAWRQVAGTLELARAMGAIGEAEIAAALDANDEGDSRPLYRLAELALARIGEHLSARLQGADDGLDRAFLVGVEPVDWHQDDASVMICLEGCAEIACTMPLLEMDTRVAKLCMEAVELLWQTFHVYLGRYWGQGDLPWALEERISVFRDLEPWQRKDAASFHDACLLETETGLGLLGDGAYSLKDAGELLRELTEIEQFYDLLNAFWSTQPKGERCEQGLGADAQALTLELGESMDGRWARWVTTVCEAVANAKGKASAEPESSSGYDEGTTDIGLLLRLDLGTPWDGRASEDEQEAAMQAGDRPVMLFVLDDGEECMQRIVHALEGVADLVRLLLLAPGWGDDDGNV